MKTVLTGGTCAAVLAFSLAAFAQSTGTSQPPTQTGTQATQPQTHPGDHNQQQVTLVGCVQREADFRAARDAGRGGAVGTGAGVGNEFILVNATVSQGKVAGATSGTTTGTMTGSTSATTTGTATGSTTGTATGSTATGTMTGQTAGQTGAATGTSGSMGDAYELTGPAEGELSTFVGRRVEITGRFKEGAVPGAAASGATATGTGTGATGTVTGGTTTGTASASGRPQTGGMDVLGQDLNLREFEVMSVRAAEGTCPALPTKR